MSSSAATQTMQSTALETMRDDASRSPVEEQSNSYMRVSPLLLGAGNSTKYQSLIQGSISVETAVATHANLYGLTPEKEKRIRELYKRLDYDNDGTIDIRDMTMALKHEVPHIPSRLAPKIVARMSSDNRVSFGDFAKYVVEHEKRLEDIFRQLDKNMDGYIDVKEIKHYCDEIGVPLSHNTAQNLISKMDQTGTDEVDLAEFQNFMLLYPSSDPKDIAGFWKHNLVFDVGEDLQVPEDFSQEEMQSGVWWKHLVAGAMAGTMSRSCTAPLDRVKVYLQVHATKANKLRLYSAVNFLYKEGGLKSFWRGNGINVIKIAPESAIKFMAYEQVKRFLKRLKGDTELTVFERFAAGSSAGAISQTIIYPMEVLKTRLALRRTGQLDKGLIHFAYKLYLKEGFHTFYKGYVPNLLGIIPYAGIDLAIYETLKSFYVSRYSDLGSLAISADPTQPDTMTGQFRFIWRNEGLTGLYRGIAPNFMKLHKFRSESCEMLKEPLIFPTGWTAEEKHLKEMHEKLKALRKRLESARRERTNDKNEKEIKKRIEAAEMNTEKLRKKIASGVITVKKVDEKREFKRLEKRGRLSSTSERRESQSLDDTPMSPPGAGKAEGSRPRKEPRVEEEPDAAVSVPESAFRPTEQLYFRGSQLTESIVRRVFSAHGTVRAIDLDGRKRTGFVWMESVQEAERAMKAVDESVVEESIMHVSIARRPKPPPLMSKAIPPPCPVSVTSSLLRSPTSIQSSSSASPLQPPSQSAWELATSSRSVKEQNTANAAKREVVTYGTDEDIFS